METCTSKTRDRRAYDAAWYLANRKKILAASAAYVKANPEKTRAKHRAWNKANREKLRAKSAAWRAANPEKARAVAAAYAKANPDKFCAKVAKRNATKLRATPAWADFAKIAIVYTKAQEWGMEADHIVPLQSEIVCGLHCWENLQLLCAPENSSKGNRHWPDM